jgi:hypothetical protein
MIVPKYTIYFRELKALASLGAIFPPWRLHWKPTMFTLVANPLESQIIAIQVVERLVEAL